MKLIVDHREGEKVIGVARKICETETAQLPLGDILVVDGSTPTAVVIERKTSRDFVDSVRNNRLWEQLLRFMKSEDILGYKIKRRILLIHGSFIELTPVPYNERSDEDMIFWSSMMGAFLEALFVYDTPVVVAENDIALEAFLRTEVKREEEGENDSMPESRWHRDWKKSPWELPTKDDRRLMLSAIPMIGEEHAKKIIEHFGSLANVADASLEELLEVPGIGEKRAKRIYDIFR
jgi:ERCC4-type nuclease